MAQFIAVALKATIVIAKKRIVADRIPTDIALETVTTHYDLSLYDYSETDHFHLWKLKDDLLSVEIVPFLTRVYKFYYDKEEGNYETLVGEIKRRKDYDSVFKIAKNAEYEHFELDNKQYSQFHLKKFGKHLQVDFNYIQLFKSERLRMDTFDKMMMFFSNCMQKTFSEFELSKALDIYIVDTKLH